MEIGKMAAEELTTALGDRADEIGVDVFEAVNAGAAAARTALGSDVLYEHWLAQQVKRLQDAEAQDADAERASRAKYSRFLDYDEKQAAGVNTRQFLER